MTSSAPTLPVLPVTDLNGQPFSKDLSPFTQDFKGHTSAVTPPPGHFLLPYGALVLPGDRLYGVGTYSGTPEWRMAYASLGKRVGEFMVGDGSSHIRAYCRAMTRDTTMFAAMSEYASKPIVAPKVEALPADLTPYSCPGKLLPAPEPGRFMLPAGTLITQSDRAWTYPGWTPTCCKGARVGQPPADLPYSRSISDDLTLYAAMQEEALKAQTPILLARTEELTTQVASLKAELDRLRYEHRPIQVGDWVVCTNGSAPLSGRDKTPVVLGQLYQVERVCGNGYDLVGLPDGTHVWSPVRFRRATPAEVSAHLAFQRAKVGDWVYCVENVTSNSLTSRVRRDDTYAVRAVGPKGYQLTRPEAGDTYWGFRSFRTPTPDELNRHLLALETKAATEAVAAKAAAKAVAEMGAKLVTITVDGVDYVSDYRGGAVLFGCAKINNDLIRRAHNLLHHAPQAPVVWGTWGNRSIEGVLIGKGLFTKADLARLVSNLID